MKVSELRIGNFVHKLIGYTKYATIQVNAKDISNYEVQLSHLYPVELTVELLKGFGFKIQGRRISKDWFYLWYDDEKIVFALAEMQEETGAYLVIKHVHQLQNLYYAVTGEELTPLKPI